MPRSARVDIPGALHHIICRGIEGRKIFLDDTDRDDFVSRLVLHTKKTSTRCFSWALLPNHLHLLLETGLLPVAQIMQKILSGYATSFNRRHRRRGHLFQNRYKSILCQAEPYLLELVRYIHLNPLRAGIVSSLEELRHYRYCGHGCILGVNRGLRDWMATEDVLARFGASKKEQLVGYEAFLSDGVPRGRRPELVGGGLIRSAGGWREVIAAREAGIFLKSDERVLGDSDFVESLLTSVDEALERKTACRSHCVDLDTLAAVVAELLAIKVDDIWAGGKHRSRVQARSILCYWAIRELGLTGAALARKLRMCESSMTVARARGEQLVAEKQWQLSELLTKMKI